MLPSEALELLDGLEFNPDVKSKINPSFNRGQMHQIVRDGIAEILSKRGDRDLDRIMEKRVHQCLRNQRRPRF